METNDLLSLMLFNFRKFVEDNSEKTIEELIMEYDLKLNGN